MTNQPDPGEKDAGSENCLIRTCAVRQGWADFIF